MRSVEEFELVLELVRMGLNDCAISRATGIPRPTVRDWRVQRVRSGGSDAAFVRSTAACPLCGSAEIDGDAYVYLLGLYLGDGTISKRPRNVYRLRIFLDQKYPAIIGQCSRAMESVCKNHSHKTNRLELTGCVEVSSYWKHWPCLFPQHGPGPKHLRNIELEDWQETIVGANPYGFLRGLVHSDGCRGLNFVNGKGYPYYQFCNHSRQIREIFCRACDRLGLAWRQSNWKNITLSRRGDVALLDSFIGPKR